MIKYSKILLALGVVLLAASCVEDKGNYDYEPVEAVKPLEISGVEDAVYEMAGQVSITPGIKKYTGEQIDDADYDFVWYVYSGRSTTLSQVDTLARTRNVTFTASFPIDVDHTLVFEVKDKRTGIFERAKATIKTASDFSRGFFVLKDEKDMTDLDIVKPDGTVVPDVLSATNGERMEGRAKKIYFVPKYLYKKDDGTAGTDKKAHHVFTEKDFRTFDAADMTCLKTFDEEFFYAPEVKKPQGIISGWQAWMGQFNYLGTVLMNDGRMHAIADMGGVHFSEFDYQRSVPDVEGGIDFYPGYILWAWGWYGYALMYDQTESTFYFGDMSATAIAKAPEGTSSQVSPHNMNAEMLWMQQIHDYTSMAVQGQGWALMKGKSDGKYNLVKLSYMYGSYPISRISSIAASRKLVGAEVREPYIGSSETIWFGHGNQLWYYQYTNNDESSTEKAIYTFGEGETVTHISHFQDQPTMLVVCTSTGSGWKLYKFTLKASLPDIDETAAVETFSGTGTARDVIYRP